MSNRLLTAAWSARGLTATEKLILLKLADHADNQGVSFPGHEFIAAECGLSDRCVRDTLQLIQGKGHITIKQRSIRAKKGEPKFTYLVHPLTPERASRVTAEADSGVTPENGAADTGKSECGHRKITTPTPENGARPYITGTNHQINHQGNRAPGKATLSVSDRISLENELSEIKEEIKAIAANYEGLQTWTADDKIRSRALKARRDEIKAQLNRMV